MLKKGRKRSTSSNKEDLLKRGEGSSGTSWEQEGINYQCGRLIHVGRIFPGPNLTAVCVKSPHLIPKESGCNPVVAIEDVHTSLITSITMRR